MERKLIILLLLPITLFAEVKITDNLVVNGNFESGNSNNWTTSGEVVVLNDCCGSQYDLEFGLQGSIEQDFNLTSDSITQQMLNNGITLNSSILIQNGECNTDVKCWGGQGDIDKFVVRLQIKDINNEVLTSTTQERQIATGINGETFTNSISYTEVGSNIGNIFISGTDSNGISGGLGGANVDNVEVLMTYDDKVLTTTQVQELNTTFEEIEEIIELTEEIIPEKYEEIFVEKKVIEEIILEVYPEVFEIKEEEKLIEEEIVLEVLKEEIVVAQETEIEEIQEEVVVETEPEIIEEVSQEIEEEIQEEMTEQTPEDVNAEDSCVGCEENETVAEDKEINIDEISAKVESKIDGIDKQIAVTQQIVAKLMNNNQALDNYMNVNTEFFDNQLELSEINIDEYMNKTFTDDRIIYQDVSFTNDSLHQYNLELSNIQIKRKLAEDNLRRIINGL
jgi:hypothetical protein